MGIGRLGTRSLANLAYAYLVTQAVEDAVAKAEQSAAQRKQVLEPDQRQAVIRDAVRDFDADLETVVPQGVDAERLTRAKANFRALGSLMQDFERANAASE